jgi:hypothetical protein
MAPRRPTRSTTNPKPCNPAVGKKKITKSTTKKKPVTKKATATKKTLPTTATKKTFPCHCATDCHFKSAKTDLRFVLGRPEYLEITTHVCACKVHYKCANRWASAHNALPSVLPCGCPLTTRGAEFWAKAVPGRWASMKEDEKMHQTKEKEEDEATKRKELEDKKKQEHMCALFDWGSDLTDLED